MQKCDPHVNTRLRREVNTDYYDLEKGPIIILRDPEDNFEPENAEEFRENQGMSDASEKESKGEPGGGFGPGIPREKLVGIS